jgi:tetratricopeptide (TPR) repeat protein
MRRFLTHPLLIATFTGGLAATPVLLALLGAPVAKAAAAQPQNNGPIKPSDQRSDQNSDQKDQKQDDSKPQGGKQDDSSSSSSSSSGAAQELQQADQQPKYDPLPAEKDVDVGMFYMHKGNMDAAIARFEDAIQQKADYAKPRLLLAQIYEKKHDNINAVKYYKDYLKVYPHAPDAKKVQEKIEKLSAR